MSDGSSRLPDNAIPVYIAANAGSVVNPTPPVAPPATLAGGGVWNSGTLPGNGASALAAAATLSQAGTLTIQRYIDLAGTIAIGGAIAQVMTADTPATVAVNDGLPFASFSVQVNNTSGSLGNLTGVAILTSVT